MYRINNKLAYAAIIVAALSTLFTPFLHVFLAGNWNLFEVDPRLFYITNGFLLFILITVYFGTISFFKILTKIYTGWLLLAIVGVYFQINNYFGMKFADGLIAKTIHFKWGWIVLLLTAILLLFSIKKTKIDIHEK